MKLLTVPASRTMLVKEQDLFYTASPQLRKGADLAAMLTPLIQLEPVEVFLVISLNARRVPTQVVTVARGTQTQCLCHPRDVFRAAIIGDAAGVAIAHNHPSGDPNPSPEDHALTNRMREAALLLAMPLLDHIIITADPARFFSYADLGWPRG